MEKIEAPVALAINIDEVAPANVETVLVQPVDAIQPTNVEPVTVIQTPVEEYTPEQQKFIISDEVLNAIPEVEVAAYDLPFSAFANPTPVDETVHQIVAQQAAENPDISGKEIASIKSAFYGGFIKTLETVSPGLGSEDVIAIKEGKLVITKSGGIISCDLGSIFGKNSWTLKDPVKNLKLLKLIKGGDKVTIMNDDTKYIVYSSQGQDVKTITTIIKVNENASTFMETKEIDPGVRKSVFELPLEIVSNLIAAKSAHGAIYYNITLDAVTYDLLNIDIDDKHKEIIKSETGRETIRYKVKELFPVSKPDSIIFEVYENGDQIFIKTLNDVIMTTINLQIAAMKNQKRDDLNFDRMM